MPVDLPFTSIGCYNGDMGEKVKHEECSLMDGDYGSRTDAIGKCERCAKLLGRKYFGVENGGKCYSWERREFNKGGESKTACISNGKGGNGWTMVYERKCKYHLLHCTR